MSALKTIRRITVYAAEGLEKNLIEHFIQLGSKGYTITEARGMGEHASLDDPFARSTQVRIELLVQPEMAEMIMEYIRGMTDKHLPVAACVEGLVALDAQRRRVPVRRVVAPARVRSRRRQAA